jgi:DNA mismatch endonuclease (patch repair protein)
LSMEKRSRVMSSIRGRDTKPEMMLWRELDHRVLRKHPRLPGRPDMGCISRKVAVFVDGCFWHGCPSCYKPPATRPEYWSNKLKRNLANDEKANKNLKASGFKVLRFWEHEVLRDARACAEKVNEALE